MLQLERQKWAEGAITIAGIDEAGRGPLAGPVVAGAVVFDQSFIERELSLRFSGLTDSKKLSAKKREQFFALLTECDCVQVGVGICNAEEVDSINILQATLKAMRIAVESLPLIPDYALVDGDKMAELPCPASTIIKGDSLSISIAAGSVIAKVTRDRMMRAFHDQYPEYGFDSHKGYGSKKHIEALFLHGPSPIHRKSFRPVREAALAQDWIRSRSK